MGEDQVRVGEGARELENARLFCKCSRARRLASGVERSDKMRRERKLERAADNCWENSERAKPLYGNVVKRSRARQPAQSARAGRERNYGSDRQALNRGRNLPLRFTPW